MSRHGDDLKIALNILSRVGLENFLQEYAKAKSVTHGFDTWKQMQPPPTPPNIPENTANNSVGQTIPPETGQSTTEQPIVP